MFDIGLSSAGSTVSFATSSGADHPPENIIDGKSDTYWLTTGMFPQEFVISFASTMNVNSIKIKLHNVRRLAIEKSEQSSAGGFQLLREASLEGSDGELLTHEFNISETSAQHLKFRIDSGYHHFVSVHELHIDGTAARI